MSGRSPSAWRSARVRLGSQLGQQPIGDRPQTLILLRLGRRRGPGIDRRLIALDLSRRVGRILLGSDLRLRLDRQFVLRSHIAPIDA